VDFHQQARALAELQAQCPDGIPSPAFWRELHANAWDGRIKQLVTWRLLQLRQHWPDLFRDGSYQQLPLEGAESEHAVAFVRVLDGRAVLVIAARLTYTLCKGEEANWAPGAWDGVQVRAAEMATLRRWGRWRHWLTGTEARVPSGSEPVALTRFFEGAAGLPFAVLVADSAEATA
jgi:(1->4)-alpha-D-glucan 1-alpha-D-glucosylmutase